jgi:hypothetical protein
MDDLRISPTELAGLAAPKRKKRRTTFQTKWARIPDAWRRRLRSTQSAHAVNLAITILFEAHRAEQCGTEIVLSAHVTGIKLASGQSKNWSDWA